MHHREYKCHTYNVSRNLALPLSLSHMHMHFHGSLGTMTSRVVLSAALAAGGITVGSAILLGNRYRRLEMRRSELDAEYVSLLTDLRSLDDSRLAEVEALDRKAKENILLHETVDTLWSDRLARYKQANKEMYSYLKALPEALDVFRGINNHYRYMAMKMPEFFQFDVACSKVHNFALLLAHGERVGIDRVAETIRQLLIAEPLVRVVCDSVIDSNSSSRSPTSVDECSTSFEFCIKELRNAIESASNRYVELCLKDGLEKAPNVMCETLHKIITKMKANTMRKGDVIAHREQEAFQELLRSECCQLRMTVDLEEAMKYVEEVTQGLRAGATGDDALLTAISADPEVVVAQQQLQLWRRSTAAFLVRQQAMDALSSYQILLAETLTKASHPHE
ncbi:hypothetical protein TRVL_01124 [Trypanosoma vivax]|nr:hypothetical protein TRVL_01124 [Trypanosoma vivax]